jgi:hypothetical protein
MYDRLHSAWASEFDLPRDDVMGLVHIPDNSGYVIPHMGRLERGEQNVSFQNILRIANAIHCKPSELFAEVGLRCEAIFG